MTGRMRPISYKAPTINTTGSGGTKATYASGGTDWAEVKAVKEENENEAGQTQQGSLLKFKIRFRESLLITDKWLIAFEGTDYKINSIEREGLRRDWYIITGKALK